MKIHRGQAFIRAWPATTRERAGKAALVGILECSGQIDDEIVHGLALIPLARGYMLATTGCRSKPEGDCRTFGVDHLLTSLDWPRPATETGLDGGGVFLRRTRIPAEKGREICIFAMLLSSSLPRDRALIKITGDLPGTIQIQGTQPSCHLQTNGSTLGQVLQMPIWGWNHEQIAITSTLHLDVLDQCRRYDELLAGAEPSDQDEQKRLEREMAGSVMRIGMDDQKYQKFRHIWIERHGMLSWRGWETLSEQERTQNQAEAIVRELLQVA